MKSNYQEKKERRISRYSELSKSLEQQSQQAFDQSHKAVENIPLGQPILVGHHSEGRHRRTLERSWNLMGKGVELSQKAEYYSEKAFAAENNNMISSDDPEAESKLRAKIERLEKYQEIMKSANKIIKSSKMPEVQKIDEMEKIGIPQDVYFKLVEPDYCGRIGFPSYQLTNNNANINRLKDRLKQLERVASIETKEHEFGDIRIIENSDENRLQIFFPGKPDDATRGALKSNGFRWSPSVGCWQSFLKPWSLRNAKRILNIPE